MATATGVLNSAEGERSITKSEERRVIVASSVGTVFEWYDFYLYAILAPFFAGLFFPPRSEEHTSELQSHYAISYAVFCLKKKNTRPPSQHYC